MSASGETGTRGVTVVLTSRERPTLFEDRSDGSRYLFTGASVNKTMYFHSFTLVQQVRSARP